MAAAKNGGNGNDNGVDGDDDDPLAHQVIDIESVIVGGKVYISATDSLSYLRTVSDGLQQAVTHFTGLDIPHDNLESQRIIVDGMIGALLEGIATLPNDPG